MCIKALFQYLCVFCILITESQSKVSSNRTVGAWHCRYFNPSSNRMHAINWKTEEIQLHFYPLHNRMYSLEQLCFQMSRQPTIKFLQEGILIYLWITPITSLTRSQELTPNIMRAIQWSRVTGKLEQMHETTDEHLRE